MALRRTEPRQPFLAALGWALLLFISAPTTAFALTVIDDDIAVDTTWSQAGGPYFITRIISVEKNATLTVEAGVQVLFAEDTYVVIKGALEATGLPGQPVVFARADPKKRWFGIHVIGTVAAPARATFTYALVEQAGTSSTGNVIVFDGHVTARHSTFRNSPGDGILGQARSGADLSDCAFTGNGGYAARLGSLATKPVLARLTAAGNGVDAIAIGGSDSTIVGNDVWEYSGVPYVATSGVTVPFGATLTLEPGVEVRFAQNTLTSVMGTFRALGTAARPITLTAVVKTPGYWFGLAFGGSVQTPAAGVLDYTTVEFGGHGSNGANFWAMHARVRFAHGIIRQSVAAGVRFGVGTAGSVIETSRIVDNATVGVTNQDPAPRSLVLAPNNWWGSPSGPTVAAACNPGGTGQTIEGRVAFRPFLTSPDQDAGAIAPGEARVVSMRVTRWFAPADGTASIPVTLTLRDGNGRPLAGRRVRVESGLGSVVDGGITDPSGTTSATVRSSTPGDADLVPVLESTDTCEYARGDATKVTFTPVGDASPLTPDAEAPYVNSGIEITPRPIVRGVPTTLRIRFTNPNDFSILVDTTFGYAQAGLGVAFGPIADVPGTRIESHGVATVQQVWTPAVSGHYCIQVDYVVRSATASASSLSSSGPVNRLAASAGGRTQQNLNVYPGSSMSPPTKNLIEKAAAITTLLHDGILVFQLIWDFHEAIRDLPHEQTGIQSVGSILGLIFEGGGAIVCATAGGTQCGGWGGPEGHAPFSGTVKAIGTLLEDPPSQDYRTIASIEAAPTPLLEPDLRISEARRAQVNALTQESVDMLAQLFGAVVTYDRYAGAAEAGDLQWASAQAVAYQFYLRRAGQAMVTVADRFESLLAVLQAEGDGTVSMTAENYRAYQDRLRTSGFTLAEIDAARRLGLSDEGLEVIRQARLARDPAGVTGPLPERVRNLATALRVAGQAILSTPGLTSSAIGAAATGTSAIAASGDLVVAASSHVASAATIDVSLVRLSETTATIQVGNPLAARAAIDVRVRPLGLPVDWSVAIDPQTVTLDPGQQTTVSVTIRPGTSVPQGVQPRVAIEGYNAGQLIGGVVLHIVTPVALLASEDRDGDGLPDTWETTFGLHENTAAGAEGALGDPDGDGVTNLEELLRGTHPRGLHKRYLAEGALNDFFDTRLALLNVGDAPTTLLLQLLQPGGATASIPETLAPGRRRTIRREELSARLTSSDFSVVLESDQPVVLDRTMSWDGSGYGSHAETGVLAPSTTWYFAEGSTSSFFSLFYLLQNPNPKAAMATIRYLRPFGLPPIVKTYTLDPLSRTTIAIDDQGEELASMDVSAVIETTVPIIAERAMYWSTPVQTFAAGHGSAGVIAPATQWFLAEGATGPFFDCFILLANPNAQAASVTAEYLLSDGTTQRKAYTVPANGRVTIFVDAEEIPEGSGRHPLENVAVSTAIASDMPIIVERTMWWPSPEITPLFWTEAHNSPGATTTGTRWALAEGEVGGAQGAETYLLLANTSAFDGSAQVTLYFEDGTSATRIVPLAAKSRTNVNMSIDFPEAADKRFGAVVDSLGNTPAQIVVERAMYTSPAGVTWAAGTNAVATRLR